MQSSTAAIQTMLIFSDSIFDVSYGVCKVKIVRYIPKAAQRFRVVKAWDVDIELNITIIICENSSRCCSI